MSPNRGRKSSAMSIPPSVGGMNDINSLADMPVEDAIQLENWFPSTSSVDLRYGSEVWSTGFTGTPETLMGYNGPSGRSLWAVADKSIYAITTKGAISTAAVTSLTNNRFSHCMFGGAGNSYLVAVNGADYPQFYNGSAWTYSGAAGGYAAAITGVTATSLSFVTSHVNRLFFIKKSSLEVWFLASLAIGGAASMLDLAGFAKRGGYLVALASLPSSAGVTLSDYFVALTSEGEAIVFRGTDPTDAAAWEMVGVFRTGRPIGDRSIVRIGEEMAVITADGLTTMQAMLSQDVEASRAVLTDKIVNAVTRDVSNYGDNFGWQAMLAPQNNKLIINVPTSSTTGYQYIQNTITQAWCKWSGTPATCWAYWADQMWCASNKMVLLHDQPGMGDYAGTLSPATTVAGYAIEGIAKTAFNYLGDRGSVKRFQMVRPLIYASSSVRPAFGINVNLADAAVSGSPAYVEEEGAKWDTAKWDEAVWAGGQQVLQRWGCVSGIGYCAAMKMVVKSLGQPVSWLGWDLMYEVGGGML